ncbi:MAG: ubiquitin-conjugating enzyme E2 [Barrevirus sp.]|uniref:E2 ubiquitin-conjugating enzyme n=1 Tax=Barrevirus sp. TaxID=2487763 RepID=A0A3G4ZRQ1_9VIRU|nr:MAG: ubiquitin-conjugating enzyme E2 [Barrevirus sp.]
MDNFDNLDNLELKNIKYIRKNGNRILFELSNQQFYIIVPNQKDEFHFLEIEAILTGYTWLSKVNEYIFDKNPKLQDILTFIEKKYSEQNKIISGREPDRKVNKMDLFDNIPNLEIDTFDLEERKYRRKLESVMSTKKSKLNLNTNPNNSTTVPLFSGKVPSVLIMNEFFELRKKYSRNTGIIIELADDNIYTWTLKFKNFTNAILNRQLDNLAKTFSYDYIEIEVDFHDTLYPSYPPFLRIVRPRLNNGLMNKITNMKMVQTDYWTPCRGMLFIVNKLYNVLNEHCLIDTESEMNDITKYKDGAYHSLEAILVKLASLTDIKDEGEGEQLDKEVYNKIVPNKVVSDVSSKKPTKKKTVDVVWGKGKGFGHSGAPDWDLNAYLKMQEEKDKQIKSVLSIIMDALHNYKDEEMPLVYNIIKNSYLIPFIKSYLQGTNILEMSKHYEMYQYILLFMQILATENSIFLFDNYNESSQGLYDLLTILNKEAIQIAVFSSINKKEKEKEEKDSIDSNYDISTMISSLYDMITPIFNTYLENKKKFILEKEEGWQKKIENAISTTDTVKQEYERQMNELMFDTCKFTSSYAFANEIKGGSRPSKIMSKRLASEYAAMINGLPVFFESSVFVRVNEQDNRCVKVLITGPNDTPYSCGCFIFDLFTGNNYPTDTPKMLFLNTGNTRMNPNLYNCGKVCLSLLGTWSGKASEGWNASTSTLSQVFISIQSQILVDEPYFNEPGHESNGNNPQGKEASRLYNCERRYYTLLHCMYNLLIKNDYPEFTNIIKKHFTLKKNYIIDLIEKWKAEPNNKFEKNTIEIADKLKLVLEKLT